MTDRMTISEIEKALGAKYTGSAKISHIVYFESDTTEYQIPYDGMFSGSKIIRGAGKMYRELGFYGLDFVKMTERKKESNDV